MSSSQGSQVQTLVIELSENLLFSNETMPKANLSLCSSLFLYRFLELCTSPWNSKTLNGRFWHKSENFKISFLIVNFLRKQTIKSIILNMMRLSYS